MLETLVTYLQSIPPEGVLLFALGITFLENIFPPSPSDTLLVFCGTLVGLGTLGFLPLWIVATVGSVAGFLTMYFVGRFLGKHITQWRIFRFISEDALEQVERWFQRYGYWLIVANRFLSGTRAVISFFAGVSRLRFDITLVLSSISSLIWNALLIYAGALFGENWQTIAMYLEIYGKTITSIIALLVVIWVVRWIYLQSREKQVKEDTSTDSEESRSLPDDGKESSDKESSVA